MSPPRGVILDIDGTLVDSNDAHAHAWFRALAEAGVNVAWGEIRRRIGMGSDKLLPAVAKIDAESDRGKEVTERRGEIFKATYLPSLRPTIGATRLVRHLHDLGFALAVATSSKKDDMDELLKICDPGGLIDIRISSDDAENSKPDPDTVAAALQKMRLKPAEAILLGDTPYDVEAATRIGVEVMAFRSGGWEAEALAGAVAVYDHPADLLHRFGRSRLALGR